MTHGVSTSLEGGPVSIPVGEAAIAGDLVVPRAALGVVLFAHGSGSSRHSPRNQFVAQQLQEAGFATLLMDLLTVEEEQLDEMTGGELRFDIRLLTNRIEGSTEWVRRNASTHGLPMGYFGASTGAAAALMAAAGRGDIGAVVSRGGRPDLAEGFLGAVGAPTLLIVGGADGVVIDLNRQALNRLRCEKRLEIVPRASHLFEEPGALEQVSALAAEWFGRHLGGA